MHTSCWLPLFFLVSSCTEQSLFEQPAENENFSSKVENSTNKLPELNPDSFGPYTDFVFTADPCFEGATTSSENFSDSEKTQSDKKELIEGLVEKIGRMNDTAGENFYIEFILPLLEERKVHG